MSMERIEKNAAKRAAGQELTANDLLDGSRMLSGRATSKDPIAHLALDLYDNTVTAMEMVRDGRYDPEKYVVTIACSPSTAVLIAATGAAISAKRDGKSDEEATTAGVHAGVIVVEHIALGYNDVGMRWAGFNVVPDERMPYLGVAIAARREQDEPQKFDEVEYQNILSHRQQAVEADALVAKMEAMDGVANVFGDNRPSTIN